MHLFEQLICCSSQTIWLVLALLPVARSALDLGFTDDSDLTTFVSAPETKAPLFNVTVNHLQDVAPGYWFVAPYVRLQTEGVPPGYFQPCQVGPAIYDAYGGLVWSGACMFSNQVAVDFRVSHYKDSNCLSMIVRAPGAYSKHDQGVILDSSYEMLDSFQSARGSYSWNMHEFKIIDNGRRALYLDGAPYFANDMAVGNESLPTGWVYDIGFREMDLVTKRNVFEWWALDHDVLVSDSSEPGAPGGTPYQAFDYFHGNSVEKLPNGDYLVSGRDTDCVYAISGEDGHVIWRLGGKRSSFVFETGLNFSRQHDARFIGTNDTVTYISLLDNASNGGYQTASASSSLVLALDTSSDPMTAKVVKRFSRPDGRLSYLRGNLQMLSNGNVFTCWSDNSYITEHSWDGDLLLEAQFKSKRFVTYRAYKAEFVGRPSTVPALVTHEFGAPSGPNIIVCYVSWNGDTRTRQWRFRGIRIDVQGYEEIFVIGEEERQGFETVFQYVGSADMVYAEALDGNGIVLARSDVVDPQRLSTRGNKGQLLQEVNATSYIFDGGSNIDYSDVRDEL